MSDRPLPDPLDRLLARRLRDEAGTHVPCPDADLLAAYAENTLAKGERSVVERHLAGCARCTHVLALADDVVEQTVQPGTYGRRRSGLWPWTRWAAPVGAAAAGVAVWILITAPRQAPLADTTVARSEVAQPVPPAAASTAPSSRPPEAVAPDPVRQRIDAAPERATAVAPSPAAEAPRSPTPVRSVLAGEDVQDSSGRRVFSGDEIADLPTARNLGDLIALVPGVASRPPDAQGGAVPGSIVVVPTKDANIVWRSRDTAIERSADGGVVWTHVHSAPAIPTGGVAPAPDVVWFYSSNGSITRLTSSGWQTTTAPGEAPLASVRAEDANRASIELANGRAFTTTDGGITWTPQ